ncbi:MAG: chaperone modulator CbpM [Bacteroidota bacterium]
MQRENLIALDEFCASHGIGISFIGSLQENGLIEVTRIKESSFIEADQLQKLETIVRFYYELDINIAGIESITHLLNRITSMHEEMTVLRNRLRLYESFE